MGSWLSSPRPRMSPTSQSTARTAQDWGHQACCGTWDSQPRRDKETKSMSSHFNNTYFWTFIIAIIVHSPSHLWLFATPWTAARQASLSFTISLSSLKLKPIELVMPSNHLILCRLLLLLPSIFPSIRVFSKESAVHIRWPKYWSFNISPSKEYSRLTSFKIDWFDLLIYLCYL